MSNRIKRNVADVDYATQNGDRPMRQVLRKRKPKPRTYTRAQLYDAFRVRAGEQSMLLCCLCCYPVVRVDTDSGHEPWCPSEAMHQVSKSISARAAIEASKELDAIGGTTVTR